jgi:glycosyltransferase involved in cell wall biosynthesis
MSTEDTFAKKARRVVHLTSVHPPFDVRIFHKECKSIVRAGYDVTLIACHDRDETRDGIRLRAIPKQSSRLSRMTRGVWSTYREALRQDADLYHFHDPELIPVGLLLRMKSKKVIYDVHENLLADLAVKHYIPQLLRRPLARLVGFIETRAARGFSAVVPATIPFGLRFDLRKDHIVVVENYPAIDERQLEPRRPWAQRSASVAYVGVLSRDRCVTEMVRAMALLPSDLQVTLRLAGPFSPKEFQEELAGIDGRNRTHFLGTLDRTQVAELLGEVCVGLVILRPTPGYLQALPTKMFEYMSAGIPVIVSDFPRLREIVVEARCGLLVDPLDPRAIAQAVEYLVRSPEEAEQMGQRGQEAVRTRYNWASEERKLLNLYGTLLNSPCAV